VSGTGSKQFFSAHPRLSLTAYSNLAPAACKSNAAFIFQKVASDYTIVRENRY
jgi:hypothetical protein